MRYSDQAKLARSHGAKAYRDGGTTNDCPYKPGDGFRGHWFQGFTNAAETTLGTRCEVEMVRVDKVYLYVADGNPRDMIIEAQRRCPGYRVEAVGEQTLVTWCEGCSEPLFDGDDYRSGDDCYLCPKCYAEAVKAAEIDN